MCWLRRSRQRARGNPLRTIARAQDSRGAKGRGGFNRERHGASRFGFDRTSDPLTDLRALRRHLKASDTYAVVTAPLPAAVRREVGSRIERTHGLQSPPHTLRWLKDDRAVFSGADQPVVSDRARDKALVQRAGQLMYELSVLYPAISGLPAEWAWSLDITKVLTACRLWGCTAIFRGICSQWRPRGMARPLRGSLPGSCCVSIRKNPTRETSFSDLRGSSDQTLTSSAPGLSKQSICRSRAGV